MPYWEWSKIGKQLKNENTLGVVIMDLSKACDTLSHKAFFAKLEAYDLRILYFFCKVTLLNNTNALEKVTLLVTGKVWLQEFRLWTSPVQYLYEWYFLL